MKIINYGKVNDLRLFAIVTEDGIYPLTKSDLEFQKPDIQINYDSGVYPSITNLAQYICDTVYINNIKESVKMITKIAEWKQVVKGYKGSLEIEQNGRRRIIYATKEEIEKAKKEYPNAQYELIDALKYSGTY